jgi:hypothetical protein
MIVIGWTDVVAPQDNSAVALAVGLTLAGLRTQPLKDVEPAQAELRPQPLIDA